jgi:hypothetical protein
VSKYCLSRGNVALLVRLYQLGPFFMWAFRLDTKLNLNLNARNQLLGIIGSVRNAEAGGKCSWFQFLDTLSIHYIPSVELFRINRRLFVASVVLPWTPNSSSTIERLKYQFHRCLAHPEGDKVIWSKENEREKKNASPAIPSPHSMLIRMIPSLVSTMP